MRITRSLLAPACVIDIDPIGDSRGFFARSFDADIFAAHGLPTEFVQSNVSFNASRFTLRGMHYQTAPHSEGKLVRCTRGAAFDVMIDLRPHSANFCRWTAVELSEENRRMVYVPPGFAHGFQTLRDGTELFYEMTERYDNALSRGLRWDDPAFGIAWPSDRPILSSRDATYPPMPRQGWGCKGAATDRVARESRELVSAGASSPQSLRQSPSW